MFLSLNWEEYFYFFFKSKNWSFTISVLFKSDLPISSEDERTQLPKFNYILRKDVYGNVNLQNEESLEFMSTYSLLIKVTLKIIKYIQWIVGC